MRNFAIAIGIILLVAVIVSYFLPFTILVQMQILRVGVFMLYIGMLYLSYFLVEMRKEVGIRSNAFAILSLSFITLITPLIPILLWYLTKIILKNKKNPAWIIPIIIVIQALTIHLAIQNELLKPVFTSMDLKHPGVQPRNGPRTTHPLRRCSSPHLTYMDITYLIDVFFPNVRPSR